MCLIRSNENKSHCQNCGGHLALIGNSLRECELCGRIEKDKTHVK